jgi:hypothetical protein
MPECDLYLTYSLAEGGIGCRTYLQFGLSLNPVPLGARADVGMNGPDHGYCRVKMPGEFRKTSEDSEGMRLKGRRKDQVL